MNLEDLDLGYLALFMGMAMNDAHLAALHRRGHPHIRNAHGYVFQHLVDGPRTVTEIATRLGVSQQAASKSVAELRDLGYLEDAPSPDRRSRNVALTAKALSCIDEGRTFRSRAHAKLEARHGKASIDRTRRLLARILEDLGGADEVRARRVRAPR